MTLQSKSTNSTPENLSMSHFDGTFFHEPQVSRTEELFAMVGEKVENIFNYQRELTKDINNGTDNNFEQIVKQEQLEVPKSKFEVLAEARRDVQLLLAELKYKARRTEILLGTKQEQAAFLSRIENCLLNPGILTQRDLLKSMFETIITDELANGISRAKNFSSVLELNPVGLVGEDVIYNFPAIDQNSTLIPMDIHLAFEPKHTVREALERLDKQYKNRFNAITLIDSSRVPLGLINIEELKRHSENTQLQDVSIQYSGPFWTLNTPSKEIEESMHEQNVNIFPITDTQTSVLIGYITHETVTLQEIRVYLGTYQAKISGQILKEEIVAVSKPGEEKV